MKNNSTFCLKLKIIICKGLFYIICNVWILQIVKIREILQQGNKNFNFIINKKLLTFIHECRFQKSVIKKPKLFYLCSEWNTISFWIKFNQVVFDFETRAQFRIGKFFVDSSC